MKFPFHLIIEYTNTKPAEVEIAAREFFGNYILREKAEEEEIFINLFSEWLIYEYRQKQGNTFLAEYILKNPDHLSFEELDNMTQIFKTQFYSEFQIVSVKPETFIELEDIATGKIYKVFDKLGSKNTKEQGLLRARLAQVNGKWYMVGSNPIFLPMVYTPRMKKILREDLKDGPFTIKDTIEMIKKQASTPTPVPQITTKKELEQKRSQLQSAFKKAAKKYNATLSYEDLAALIYEENRVNVLDFWRGLTKKGLPEGFLVNELQLLQDMWNYLPHKCLNRYAPIEVFSRLKKEGR